jgi:lipopolysaccharide/colanic/teichoic acid biosynthesis glycosyltransferase/O-antigen/teichoic acid export membrane protein
VDSRLDRLQRGTSGLISRASISNFGAQIGALASLTVASLLVARAGGAEVLGEYTLFRVLPWLFGVVLSFGLPTASAFFLAGEDSHDPDLRPTLFLMTTCGATLGVLVWLACASGFHVLFFKQVPLPIVVVISLLIVTSLYTVTAKACCQGSHDIAGANLVIVMEELWFVICFPIVVLVVHQRGITAVATSMIMSGTLAALTGILRLVQKGFFRQFGTPSFKLGRRIALFGARGQLGNLLWLTNLRFDFILLGALAGPSVLGIYSIASKFAELLRLPPTALNYVLYPRFAKLGRRAATNDARALFSRALILNIALTPFVALAALVGPRILYGAAFQGAVKPAEIIILGLSIEGAAAVASAYLLGTGRPGLNSVGMGVGATLTIALDLLLIPKYGAMGGAITSAVAYASTTIMLSYIASRIARKEGGGSGWASTAPLALNPSQGADTRLRRTVDIVIALATLILSLPVFLVVALAVKFSSRGPSLYKQTRIGRSGRPFTLLKFRSMVINAEQLGGYITEKDDKRVTKIGRVLRASKLDELPQFINILKGDMTLVGPRPEVPYFLRWYSPWELEVLAVRPGLTGTGQLFYTLDQANGSNEAQEVEARYVLHQLHQKLMLDLHYLRERGLSADLVILMRTLGVMVQHSKKTLLSPVRTFPTGVRTNGQPQKESSNRTTSDEIRSGRP